jgi:hypothetical protein
MPGDLSAPPETPAATPAPDTSADTPDPDTSPDADLTEGEF